MNRWPSTTSQEQRKQHNAKRASHLATQRKDREFPVRDYQGRHIDIYSLLPVGAKPSTDYRFWTSGGQFESNGATGAHRFSYELLVVWKRSTSSVSSPNCPHSLVTRHRQLNR